MAAANAALYRAKMQGRDRVVSGKYQPSRAAADVDELKQTA
jgi:hypothetical protein